MAKPSAKITKTVFTNNYNIDKILTDKVDIMKQLQFFNSQNQAVAFATKKKPKDTTPAWFKQFEDRLNSRLEKIETDVTNIKLNQTNDHELLIKDHDLLEKVITLNNLKTK